ncbi:diguanylate cyclase, partial [Arthrobacter frigidicola]
DPPDLLPLHEPSNHLSLLLATQLQKGVAQPVPLLFFSHHEADTPTRLAAVRAGGQDFLTGSLEASSLLEKVELLTNAAPHDPLRVLIIDDSRTQALHTERVLASAGMVTRSLTDPIRTMAELADFQPDLIILDLYMPACTGPELAKVIRHSDRYVSVPIIYLSAEDDLDKQLDAMSEGGDDFLTKPFRSRHLITTVRNRAARARHLKARMVRDSLTGLYNHTHILQLLEDCSFRARREQQPLSFAMLDIDHFKRINDSLGHDAGDELLKVIASHIKAATRHQDLVARLGGDEFCVVTSLSNCDEARHLAQRIMQRMKEPIDLGGRRMVMTTSIGISIFPDDGTSAEELLKHADLALYQSKDSGRNGLHFFNETLKNQASLALQLEEELRIALLEERGLCVHYQPIFDMRSGQVA